MMEFKKGDCIKLQSGNVAVIEDLLGQGGQGTVYTAHVGDSLYALKWYLPDYLRHINQKKFYDNLYSNFKAGKPSDQFLWMIDVSEYKKDSFGYLMELRPARFSSFSSILNASNKIRSLRIQLIAARNICEAFQTLHRNGYSYQDINDGNFFIDVNNGDVLICDNDNVAPYGSWMGMAGKDRYMAPEVVLGKQHAGMESDLYSLAVVLYMLFFISHPLEGKAVHACPCLTTKYIRKFYAENPVFVFNPTNDSNKPVSGIDNNILTLWPLYPNRLKNMFTTSFTDGLFDAGYRMRENEWIDCFDDLLDGIIRCPVCGGEQFYEKISDKKNTFICEDCDNEIRKPFVWTNKNKNKNLYPGVSITRKNIDGRTSRDIEGKVVESQKHPGLWGIQNTSDIVWTAKLSNGKSVSAGKNEVLPLFDGTKLIIEDREVLISI